MVFLIPLGVRMASQSYKLIQFYRIIPPHPLVMDSIQLSMQKDYPIENDYLFFFNVTNKQNCFLHVLNAFLIAEQL